MYVGRWSPEKSGWRPGARGRLPDRRGTHPGQAAGGTRRGPGGHGGQGDLAPCRPPHLLAEYVGGRGYFLVGYNNTPSPLSYSGKCFAISNIFVTRKIHWLHMSCSPIFQEHLSPYISRPLVNLCACSVNFQTELLLSWLATRLPMWLPLWLLLWLPMWFPLWLPMWFPIWLPMRM